jgi:hypothetical protein
VFDVALQVGSQRAVHGPQASSRDRLALATSPMRDRNSVPICAA